MQEPNESYFIPPAWLSFLSGFPDQKRRKRNILIVQAYVDEAGGKGQSSVFVFSALLARAKHWVQFAEQWQAILDESPKIGWFKYYEASKRQGQFRGFSHQERDEKIKKLLLPMKGLLEVFCVADMKGFSETLGKFNTRPLKDPYFQQFHILIMAIGLTLIDLGFKEPFEIFFDEHKIFGPKAKAWYPIVRDICDEELRAVMPVEPFFRSDKEVLPLQAADMLAGIRRAWNDKTLKELEWLAPELEKNSGILLSAHSQYLDTERMMGIVKLSYSPETTKRVNTVMGEYRRKLGPDWMPPYMSKNGNQEYKQFDDLMSKLLKVPHSELKAKLDAEKTAKKRKAKTSASRASSDKD